MAGMIPRYRPVQINRDRSCRPYFLRYRRQIMEGDVDRRSFIKKSSAASLLACFPASLAGIERLTPAGTLERRALGRTGEHLSIIGFGGIVVMNATTHEASRRVAEAVDRGVNYFDV